MGYAHNVKVMLKRCFLYTTYSKIPYICNAFQKRLADKKVWRFGEHPKKVNTSTSEMTQKEVLRCGCDLWKPGKIKERKGRSSNARTARRPNLPQWGELLWWRQKETMGTWIIVKSTISTEDRWKEHNVSISKWVGTIHNKEWTKRRAHGKRACCSGFRKREVRKNRTKSRP